MLELSTEILTRDLEPMRKETLVAAIIVNRDRPDLTDTLVEKLNKDAPFVDTYVVEMGSTNRSKYESVYYDDPDYRGKCFGHNVGLRHAMKQKRYDYYIVMMNDVMPLENDTIQTLIRMMNKYKGVGLMSPSEPTGRYPSCKPTQKHDLTYITTCDYLFFIIRGSCVNQQGLFLNPAFQYCWGAIHELSYHLYKSGWKVAYCNKARFKHFGGTTYGKVKKVISRGAYQRRARLFASKYFRETYGSDWDVKFTRALPSKLKFQYNTYILHKKSWERIKE